MGELDNTLVIFTSDNGGHREGGHDYHFFNSNGGLRGYKRHLYEGGIRIPLIAAWKGQIKAGTVSDHQGAFYDFMPCFAEIAGLATPPHTDGISFLPELRGLKQKQHDYLYWEIQIDGWGTKLPAGGFRQALRMGKWKGVRYGIQSDIELYDLENDLNETRNMASDKPDVVKKIKQLFQDARTETEGFPYGGKVQDYIAAKRYKENMKRQSD